MVFSGWLATATELGAQSQAVQPPAPAPRTPAGQQAPTPPRAARVVRLTPKDLGTFPNAQHKAWQPIANASDVKFRNWLIDPDFPSGATAQTHLCDFTGDGKLDYMVGGSGGRFIFTRHDDGTWTRYMFRADRGPTDVGAVALDLTGDGLCDVITGTQWVKNPGFANGDFVGPNAADKENGWLGRPSRLPKALPVPTTRFWLT